MVHYYSLNHPRLLVTSFLMIATVCFVHPASNAPGGGLLPLLQLFPVAEATTATAAAAVVSNTLDTTGATSTAEDVDVDASTVMTTDQNRKKERQKELELLHEEEKESSNLPNSNDHNNSMELGNHKNVVREDQERDSIQAKQRQQEQLLQPPRILQRTRKRHAPWRVDDYPNPQQLQQEPQEEGPPPEQQQEQLQHQSFSFEEEGETPNNANNEDSPKESSPSKSHPQQQQQHSQEKQEPPPSITTTTTTKKENSISFSCHSPSPRLCDPDGLLQHEPLAVVEQLVETLHVVRKPLHPLCGTKSNNNDNHQKDDATLEIQLAVALVGKMDLSVVRPITTARTHHHHPHHNNDDPDDDRVNRAAERFAQELHNRWGVGMVTPCGGGTGVVLFVSLHDRALYISRGKALEPILTPARLDHVLNHVMKPYLRNQELAAALVEALHALDAILAQGPPSFWERLQTCLVDYAVLLWFVVIGVFLCWNIQRQQAEQRQYAQVASQLNEIDRARAQALQGQYRAESCPICLELFTRAKRMNQGDNTANNTGNNNRDSQQEPRQPETHGSTENEDDRHANDVNDDQQQQPLLVENQTEEKGDDDDAGVDQNETDNDDATADITADTTASNSIDADYYETMGSDGKPVQLLRCGHVFDMTCWEEWVSSGQGQVNKCPICKQDVRGGSAGSSDNNDTTARTRPEPDDENNDVQPRRRPLGYSSSPSSRMMEQRVLRQYNFERQFRLARLGRRFPQYIGSQQIQRWTQSTYNGPLARDPSFVRSDPSMRHHHANNINNSNNRAGGIRSSTFGGSGFGGGSSGGGRGGRW
ncbi:hypothetical protein ACA910_015646 [Epithemia clementina (nom. ined.)]